MTITVSLEELRSFESKVIRWGNERAFYFHAAILKNPDAKIADMTGFMQRWEASHPMPKLIPSV